MFIAGTLIGASLLVRETIALGVTILSRRSTNTALALTALEKNTTRMDPASTLSGPQEAQLAQALGTGLAVPQDKGVHLLQRPEISTQRKMAPTMPSLNAPRA